MSQNGETQTELVEERERRIRAEETLSNMRTFLFDYFHQLGPDPMMNINVVVRAVGKALRSTVALYNRLESGVLKTWSIDNEPPGYKREDSPDGHICYEMTIKNRSPDDMNAVVLNHLEATKWAKLDRNVAEYGLKNYLAFPVLLDNDVVGSLCVVDVEERSYTQIEMDILEAFSKAVTLEEERLQAQRKLAEANEALSKKNKEIEAIALTDFLTGLPNRRAIRDAFFQAEAAYRRKQCGKNRGKTQESSQNGVAIVIGDLDHFKRINDTYGHACGDAVLQGVSEVMRSALRGQDSVARWGGEEFILLLPETDLAGGEVVSERIRQRIADMEVECEGQKLKVTMTLGVSVLDETCSNIEECIGRADNALYEGKEQGRNRVVRWTGD